MKLNVDHVEVVTDLNEADEIVHQLLNDQEYVAVDLEGVNLGDGPVTLIQVASMPHSTLGEERRRAGRYSMGHNLPWSGSNLSSSSAVMNDDSGIIQTLTGTGVFGSGVFGSSGQHLDANQDGAIGGTGSGAGGGSWSNFRDRLGSMDPVNALSLGSGMYDTRSKSVMGDSPLRRRTYSVHSNHAGGRRTRTMSYTGASSQPRGGVFSHFEDDTGKPPRDVHPDVFLFDIQTNSSLIWSLEPLFSSVDVVKVIHDARGDIRALCNSWGLRFRRIFDTQVADLLIQEYRENVVMPRRSSLNSIARMYGGVVNPYKEMVRDLYYDRGFPYYDQRPLTMEMLYQAAHDVHSLIPHVYHNQIDQLKPGSEVWNRFINRMRGMVRTGY